MAIFFHITANYPALIKRIKGTGYLLCYYDRMRVIRLVLPTA